MESFKPEKGLRLEDALSPYLFVVYGGIKLENPRCGGTKEMVRIKLVLRKEFYRNFMGNQGKELM